MFKKPEFIEPYWPVTAKSINDTRTPIKKMSREELEKYYPKPKQPAEPEND